MPKELEKNYEPKEYDDMIYKRWEESGFFTPENLDLPDDAPSYTIILPPPNITAKLHLGHSAMLAIEDLMIRFHRMNGYRTLWVPGTDHAAIATQNVVERKILQEEGKTRHDLGRDKLIERIWEFLRTTQSIILNQTRKMGSSIDWSREAFTLDKQRQKAVTKIFVDMFQEGIIYRGERIVNWCPRCKSTLADDEVEHKTQSAKLYTFKYDKNFPISISTTRPETKLGDTGVAVNPKDERFKNLLGKTIEADFCGQKLEIRIIDDYQVEMEFGTGALGVTPAHSMIDWKMAEKNNLKIIKVIDEDGKIHDGFGHYSGLDAAVARGMIITALRENGLLEKEEDIENNLSICYRCDTPIEPLPSKQWFVDVDKRLDRLGGKSLKEKALEAATSRKIEFIPDRFSKKYTDWMENLHDWCISRQIWFGHRIPVWYRKKLNIINQKSKISDFIPSESSNLDQDIYVGTEPPAGDDWIQDEDSLDTWFSSGMWTFSTLGWPDSAKATSGKPDKFGDLKKYHPTQVLETGYELLTLWVSRMIIMSFFALDEIPFEKVYLHGMILDKNGKKMSKSKGNGVDPLDMIEKFGTDSVRLSLLLGSTPGNDTRFYEEKIAGMRNFVNKLWNISRFILNQENSKLSDLDLSTLNDSDYWILSKAGKLIKKATSDMQAYDFSIAGEDIYSFVWDDLADWYLETSKFEKTENKPIILKRILSDILKLLHPFTPFVTEKIWEQLSENLLMVEKWPDYSFYSPFIGAPESSRFETVKESIIAVRNARSLNKIDPARKVNVIIQGDDELKKMVANNKILISSLRTGIGEITVGTGAEKPENSILVVIPHGEIHLLDAVNPGKERDRLEKEVSNLEKYLSACRAKLENGEFVSKAPQKIIDDLKEKYDNGNKELSKLKEQLENIG